MNTKFNMPRLKAPTHKGLAGYATLASSVIAIVLLTNWPTYNYLVLGGGLALWYYLIPIALVPPVLALNPHITERLLREPLLLWFVGYVLVGLLWLFFSQGYADANRQWRLRVLALLLFSAIAVIASQSDRRTLGWVIVGCLALAAFDNWFDFLEPLRMVPMGIVETSIPGRGAGMFINPNESAAAGVAMALVALPLVKMQYRASIVLIACVGAVPTLSRFGYIVAVAVALLACAFGLLGRVQRLLLIAATVAILLLGGGVLELMENLEYGRENALGRLLWFETLGEETDFSAQERQYVAERAWNLFLQQPLVGNGIASTVNWDAPASTHNMYLLFLAEQGIAGGAVYALFLWLVFKRGWFLWRRGISPQVTEIGKTLVVYGVFMSAYSVFSHNVLEEPYNLCLMAILFASARACEGEQRPLARTYVRGSEV